MKQIPNNARQSFGDIAPHLAELTDKVLFGEIWEHPALSPRDRSLAKTGSCDGSMEQGDAIFAAATREGLAVKLRAVVDVNIQR
jgi:hypothetical protein